MFGRPKVQNRTSARLMAEIPGLHENLMGNPLLGYSSDRYGGVDRHNMTLSVQDSKLIVHGERGVPLATHVHEIRFLDQSYKVRELKFGSFHREIDVPAGTKVSKCFNHRLRDLDGLDDALRRQTLPLST